MSAPSTGNCLILNRCYPIVFAIIPTIEEERKEGRGGRGEGRSKKMGEGKEKGRAWLFLVSIYSLIADHPYDLMCQFTT